MVVPSMFEPILIRFYTLFCMYKSFRMAAGLDDVSKYPKLVEFLLSEANWTEEDIIKLIGGNILRVLEKNEQVKQDEIMRM